MSEHLAICLRWTQSCPRTGEALYARTSSYHSPTSDKRVCCAWFQPRRQGFSSVSRQP